MNRGVHDFDIPGASVDFQWLAAVVSSLPVHPGVLSPGIDVDSLLDRFIIFELNLVVLAVVALSFGFVWMLVNAYHFYPYLVLFIVPRLSGKSPAEDVYVEPIEHKALLPDDLPTIDILLPAYKEENVIHQSIESIRRANYPQEYINLVVLLEPDDDETRAALDRLPDVFEFREVTVPEEYHHLNVPEDYPGRPNKPRALNYGFELTDGDIVGVIDAEDIVDPDLFLHVYSGIVEEGHDYVQGILDMANEGDGWKNTIFRSEYAWWYRWLLPGFHYVNYPVPLGGTTNFIRRSVLEEINEARHEEYGTPWDEDGWEWIADHGLEGKIPWDPRNVTEDFELGLFLWKEGYELGLLNVVTREESPVDWNAWIQQRTRWQKGKLYTFAQYAYTMPETWRHRFHLMLQSFLPHLGPINISGIVILALMANWLGLGMPIGAFLVLVFGFICLVLINVLHAFSYWRVTDRPLGIRIVKTLAILTTLQLYWIPLWGAEQRAMKELYAGNESHWMKTPHHGRSALETPVYVDTEPATEDDARDAVDPSYEPREVVIGLCVLVFGLLITFGLPVYLL